MKKLQLNAIYPTYQGEANVRGIGAPVIFVRLQGCHLRCYKNSLGTLCDTPEGLEKNVVNELDTQEILSRLLKVHEKTKIDLVCLSGGDPLWNDTAELHSLFKGMSERGLTVSVETSGTLSALPFIDYPNLHWVFDYKLKSAAVTNRFHPENLTIPNSHVKLVIYDNDDLEEAVMIAKSFRNCEHPATIVIANYWGAKIKYPEITKRIFSEGLGDYVIFSAQLHKLITHADNTDVTKTNVPALL